MAYIPDHIDATTLKDFEYYCRTGIHVENTYWDDPYEFDPVLDELLAPYRISPPDTDSE